METDFSLYRTVNCKISSFPSMSFNSETRTMLSALLCFSFTMLISVMLLKKQKNTRSLFKTISTRLVSS